MMINANKKMVVVYMKENPVQHKGKTGREVNFEDSKLFTEPEIEKIFQAAGKIEVFFEDIFRNESFNEAAQELFEACDNLHSPDEMRSLRIKRYVRSCILEADIFLKHWERYMRHREVGDGNVFKQITSEIYDTNEAYAILCILRNYLVHSNDVVHGVHIGFDGLKIWTDRDIVLRDIEWSKAKKELLQRQEKKIDLLKVIKDSNDALNIIHDSMLSKIVTDELKEQCEFLVNMGKKTVMINSDVWFVFRFTGDEENKENIALGLGVDYYQLYWNRYRAVWEKMNKK